jgi:hypothetical protein
MFEAGKDAPSPVRASVEAGIEMAETDPQAAREALWRLQADWVALERLEERLGARVGTEPTRAVMRIGAVIHLVRAELSSPAPQLRRRLPELVEWLGGFTNADPGTS